MNDFTASGCEIIRSRFVAMHSNLPTRDDEQKTNVPMNTTNPTQIHATGEATGFIPAPGDKGKPITVIGTNSIRAGFGATCRQQALNSRSAPGVSDPVLNPDAHADMTRRPAFVGNEVRPFQDWSASSSRVSACRRVGRVGREPKSRLICESPPVIFSDACYGTAQTGFSQAAKSTG